MSAATAITVALKPKTPPKSVSRTIASETNGLSPNNQATLRRRYLEDLKMLSQLLNDGVLDMVEFTEQKKSHQLNCH